MTTEDHSCENPLYDGRLPFDEDIVLKYERHPAKNDDHRKGNEMSCLKSSLPNPEETDLKNRGDNRNRGSDENAIKFVSAEKKN